MSYFQKKALSFNFVYPRISYLLNCVFNKQNRTMNSKEMSDTLLEIRRRINDNEVYDEDNNNH